MLPFSLFLFPIYYFAESINYKEKLRIIYLQQIHLFYYNFQFSARIITFHSQGWSSSSSLLVLEFLFYQPAISSANWCFFLALLLFFYYIGWVAKFITPPSRYKDLSVKVNGFHYPAVYDSTTLNGLIMLYLHYGKQFVKTVLSAPPSGGTGQRLSCVLGAAVYRDISLLDGLRRSKYFENSWGNLEGSKGDLGAVKGCNSGWYSYQEPGLWPTCIQYLLGILRESLWSGEGMRRCPISNIISNIIIVIKAEWSFCQVNLWNEIFNIYM